MIYGASQGLDTPLPIPRKDPRFLCRPPIPYAPELIKAALKVVVAAKRALDGPEGLTTETTTQMGLYTHRRQDDRGQLSIRGAELLGTPPP
jgi:hypothetical protein